MLFDFVLEKINDYIVIANTDIFLIMQKSFKNRVIKTKGYL